MCGNCLKTIVKMECKACFAYSPNTTQFIRDPVKFACLLKSVYGKDSYQERMRSNMILILNIRICSNGFYLKIEGSNIYSS